MRTALKRRLNELTLTAEKLQAVVERADLDVLGFALCRMATAVDEATGALQRHLEALAPRSGPAERGGR